MAMASLAKSPPRINHHCWSNIPLDLMRMVFERLGFADFERAKSVCSSWLSASNKSQPTNEIPWLILFPKNKSHVLLFNPEEKQRVYRTQHLGNDYAKSFCVSTYRSWLLMVNSDHNLFILHVLTRERIVLPTSQSEYGLNNSMIFWIDEETKDYLIIRMMPDEENVVSLKKGDSSLKQIPQLSGIEECCSMVYKDHKLYCLNSAKLKIFDLSGDIAIKIFKISVDGYIRPLTYHVIGRPPPDFSWNRTKNYVVVTVSGDVLLVTCRRKGGSKTWKFEIYKIDSSKKWEEVVSLEDEAILLGLGITVLAKDMDGIKGNSIYFNDTDFPDPHDEYDVFVFNIGTKKVEQPHHFVCSSLLCSNARWFLPSFKLT